MDLKTKIQQRPTKRWLRMRYKNGKITREEYKSAIALMKDLDLFMVEEDN